MEKLFRKASAERIVHLTVAALSLAIIALLPSTSWGLSHVWSQRFGGTDFDEGRGIAVDAAGNVVVAGFFSGTVDLGGRRLTSAGLRDIFVAKYDAAGNHLWSLRVGDTGYDEAWAVAIDGADNVLVTGMFNYTVDFGGGPMTSAGQDDIFVVKYGPAGNHMWSRRFGNTDDDGGWDIDVDWGDNVLLTGVVEGTVDLGGGPLTGAGFADIFVAKYDAAGNHVWSSRYGSASVDIGGGIISDGMDNVVVTGYFGNTVNFGGGPLTSAGSADIFVAKYDPAGNHMWSDRYGGASYDAAEDIAVDGLDNVVVVGGFGGTVDFGGGPLTSAGSGDIFVAAYDPAGSHMWSRRAGDVNGETSFGVTVDPGDNVILTGFFRDTVDFGGGPLTSAGAWEIFMAKFDAGGSHVWSDRFGAGLFDCGYGIAADVIGNLLVTGFFHDTVDFGGGPLVSAGNEDIFVAKYSPFPTGIADLPPEADARLQNYPNPFGPGTNIRFTLATSTHVTLSIFDVAGRRIVILVNEFRARGENEAAWDGKTAAGEQAATGVYFYELRTEKATITRKMALLK